MTDLVLHSFEGNEVRSHKDAKGMIWFVAGDVCRALGISQTSKALKRIDDSQRGSTQIPTPGGTQEVLTLNEPGLYSLILRSNKPGAKRFQLWVTGEVLPDIRKTGSYSRSAPPQVSPAQYLQLLANQMVEQERQLLEVKSEIVEVRKIAIQAATTNAADTGYFGALAYLKLNHFQCDMKTTQRFGKECAKAARALGIRISKIRDQKFGEINAYPESLLQQVSADFFAGAESKAM